MSSKVDQLPLFSRGVLMRRATLFSLVSLAVVATAPRADAQQGRRLVGPPETIPVLRVRPRSVQNPSTIPFQTLDPIGGSAIGLGAISRVPCNVWESATPVPFAGTMADLVALCPGDLSVQIYLKRARLGAPGCSAVQGYAPTGRLASVRWCPPDRQGTSRSR
jgi:hypothetical protein